MLSTRRRLELRGDKRVKGRKKMHMKGKVGQVKLGSVDGIKLLIMYAP